MSAPQEHEFQAEVAALLRLVTKSLYTKPEIFLRELISNASDALDRARFQALVAQDLLGKDESLQIRIFADTAKKLLVIEDNGIGMTRDEVTTNLGTIAHSGSSSAQRLDSHRWRQNRPRGSHRSASPTPPVLRGSPRDIVLPDS